MYIYFIVQISNLAHLLMCFLEDTKLSLQQALLGRNY